VYSSDRHRAGLHGTDRPEAVASMLNAMSADRSPAHLSRPAIAQREGRGGHMAAAESHAAMFGIIRAVFVPRSAFTLAARRGSRVTWARSGST